MVLNKTQGVRIKIKTKGIIGALRHVDKLTKVPRKKDFHHLCGRYHVIGQCWSENQGQVCNNCGGPHASNQCRHPDKVSGAPNPPTNTTQPGQDIMRGSQNEGNNTLKPSNFYYDGNTNLPGQGGQVTQSPKQMGPSTSQDVRFMDASTIPVNLEMSTNGQGPCPPHANSISYELKGLKEEVVHEALALAVTTRAMRGNAPLEVEEEEEEEENPLGEIPYFSELENVTREARKATKALERENEIVR